MLSLLTGPIGILMVVAGQERRWALLAGASFATNLWLSLGLTPTWGLIGAAAATAVALGVLTVLGIVEASRIMNGAFLDRKILKVLGVIVVGLAGGSLLVGNLPAAPAIRLAFLVAASTGWLIVATMMIGRDSEERELYGAVRARLSGHRS